MAKRKNALLLILLTIIGVVFTAQQTEAQNVEKLLKEADQAYMLRDYVLAKEKYQEVLKVEPTDYYATRKVAQCNFYTLNYEDAAKYFEAAIEIDESRNDTTFFEYGSVLRILGRHADALDMFERFQKKWKNKDDYAERVKVEIQGCKFVINKEKEKPQYRVQCLDINTAAGDQFPSILTQTGGDSYLVFTSHREESRSSEGFGGYGEARFSDIFISKIEDDSTFGTPENMGKKINTKLNDGTTTFSPDGQTMYYSICNQGKLGFGCSIYESVYDPIKKAWNKPKVVEALQGKKEVVVNSAGKTKMVPTYDVQPSISADGNTLFFVSDRDGGYGRLDIWYAVKEGEEWSEPMNAGAKINGAFNELSPFQSKNNILYFSSDGRVGYGGADIYMSEGDLGNWSEPKNLGSPVCSSYDDFAAIVIPSDEDDTEVDSAFYFTSNRQGCENGGRDDIYYAKHLPKPPCEVAVQGRVLDKETGQPVPFATVTLYRKENEELLTPLGTFTTGQDARYNFPLECEFEYKVVGNAPEYLASDEDFNTKGLEGTNKLEINVNLLLEGFDIEKPIFIPNIFYDFDESVLREDSYDALNKLLKLMNDNPNLVVQIGSHTDTNGSEEYNKSLSERRAKSVVDWLLDNGINGNRISWYGYGESQPLIYPEMSDEDEQVNRRSEFRVLSIDFSADGDILIGE